MLVEIQMDKNKKNKPLTRTERKILVYNKCKQGKSYTEACKEVSKELDFLEKLASKKRGRKKEKTRACVLNEDEEE